MKVIWCLVPCSAEWSPAMLSPFIRLGPSVVSGAAPPIRSGPAAVFGAAPPIRSGPAAVSGAATQGLSHEVSQINLSCLYDEQNGILAVIVLYF